MFAVPGPYEADGIGRGQVGAQLLRLRVEVVRVQGQGSPADDLLASAALRAPPMTVVVNFVEAGGGGSWGEQRLSERRWCRVEQESCCIIVCALCDPFIVESREE